MDLKPLALREKDTPIIIAGPCSAETEEQVLQTALEIAASGVKLFRAGIWKPRTKPGSFEGVGAAGLAWLKRVQKETGMAVATEVATQSHVAEALAAGVDVLWIGARTTVNPFAVQEIADSLQGTDIPVLVKNPVNPDIELWIGAIQRLYRAGVRRIGAVHRGFCSHEKSAYRNVPLWQIPLELRRQISNLPIFCDPSHIGGRRNLIAPLSQQALDLNFDGLLIETHCQPETAWSDADQQITPEALCQLIRQLTNKNKNDEIVRHIHTLLSEQNTCETERISQFSQHAPHHLSDLCRQIQCIDEKLMWLLYERMKISCELTIHKN
ncbi:MAG: hypothetical protein LBT05_01075 [Planctomycetaceae bacterium]|nr:hypothetical protein [Planctomycetaceae bacterium]